MNAAGAHARGYSPHGRATTTGRRRGTRGGVLVTSFSSIVQHTTNPSGYNWRHRPHGKGAKQSHGDKRAVKHTLAGGTGPADEQNKDGNRVMADRELMGLVTSISSTGQLMTNPNGRFQLVAQASRKEGPNRATMTTGR
jgi:hypothetical protein